MSNPFTRIPEDGYTLNTNKFDWTHTRDLSTKLGMITPIFCEKLPEKSSISIDPRHAFQFMPFVFPIQSRIKCRISFYRMPIRALWKDYQNWISTVNTSQHSKYVPPFMSFYFNKDTQQYDTQFTEGLFKTMFGTGSLADHFGMPTTFDGYQNRILKTAVGQKIVLSADDPQIGETFVTGPGVGIIQNPYSSQYFGFEISVSDSDAVGRDININRISVDLNFPGYNISDITGARLISYYSTTENSNVITNVASLRVDSIEAQGSNIFSSFVQTNESFSYVPGQGTKLALVMVTDSITKQTNQTLDIPITYNVVSHMTYANVNGGEVTASIMPWYNAYDGTGLKISSYPWRMYDAIYNTFIRYTRNNPLTINGVTEYNKVTRTYDYGGSETLALRAVYGLSGAFPNDSTFKEYFGPKFANWEYDVFTTAVQSPQQGVAPLVGLTVREVTTTAGVDEQGNPIQTSSLNQYLTDEDGNQYRVSLTENELGEMTPTYEKVEMQQGRQISTLYNAVSEGMSIEDFRMVNAYTKYLELNQRRGYRYKDIIEGRYDVKLSYNELLMPEFIGGFTRDVEINPVTQTVQTVPSGTTYDGALGSKAGDAYCFGSSKANITCYNEEESFVMGLMSFTVEPVYTQTLPKFFLDRDVLDKWSPEFNNLGYQPISNAEVAPIQYHVNEPDNLNGTFGYQRPWYQYLSKVNTAHGDFRGPLRNFLMHRVFSGAPKLNKDFTIINPNHVNDVFNVTEDTDKIFGQVKLYCTVKVGVNKDAVPRLD